MFTDFATPEEFFLEEDPAPFKWGSPDPNTFLKGEKKGGDKTTYHQTVNDIGMILC